jgi:lipoyl-dependent peroxiredoxin
MGSATTEMRIALPADTAVDADVDLQIGAGGYALQIRLSVSLPGLERQVARAIIHAAEQLCPCARVLRGHMGVQVRLI